MLNSFYNVEKSLYTYTIKKLDGVKHDQAKNDGQRAFT